MGSKYALIYTNMSNCARTLNMSESAKNIPECEQTCPNMSNVVNMAEYAWNKTILNEPRF